MGESLETTAETFLCKSSKKLFKVEAPVKEVVKAEKKTLWQPREMALK